MWKVLAVSMFVVAGSSSLLGYYRLELDPGTDMHTAADGSRRRAAWLGPR
jgi:hypothetical protein